MDYSCGWAFGRHPVSTYVERFLSRKGVGITDDVSRYIGIGALAVGLVGK